MRLATLNAQLTMWNRERRGYATVPVGATVQVVGMGDAWVAIHAPGGLLLCTKTNGVYVTYLDYLDEDSPDAASDA